MFTGLVERTGTLRSLRTRGDAAAVEIACEPWDIPLAVGESVAVQGACLTVVRADARGFSCDVLRETLNKTSLGARQPGQLLNLERALRVGDRLGGHFVTGHVDGVGRIAGATSRGADRVLTVACAPELLGDIVPKGSIACDGVSLTIARLLEGAFEVHIIPHTWSHTSLSERRAGDAINIETDLIGKHVRRILGGRAAGGVTEETLRAAGF